jgi:hypothetical protein
MVYNSYIRDDTMDNVYRGKWISVILYNYLISFVLVLFGLALSITNQIKIIMILVGCDICVAVPLMFSFWFIWES